MPEFKHLFTPIMIGNMEVPNRICHVPTDVSSSNADGSVSDRDIYHHSLVAKGGTGLIIVGATSPNAKTGRSTVSCLVIDDDNYIPGFARLADSMHKYGAKCAVQLQYPGRQASLPREGKLTATDQALKLPWSQSRTIVYANADEAKKTMQVLSTDDVVALVDEFSEAAWRVKQAGFDAVELHAAHGYLISQFMSPYLNRRTDRFGGSLENRMRFPLALISAIQGKCGVDFPVLVRYSVDEWVPGGRELPESVQVAKLFEEAGVAALDLSQCIQESPGAGFDPMYYPEGWTMYASEEIKKAVSIPVINSHTLRNPEYCEKILAEGKTDMVGLARQILADPFWPIKAKYGKVDSIRKCISCLTGCWQESMMAKKEIACAINPACGNEDFYEMKRTEKPLNLAVVGGGPAGMEAARVAVERGHKATIFEKSSELGGAILGCCSTPGKEIKMKWYTDWIRNQVAELEIEVKLSTVPSIEELKSFDLVINATGAKSFVPAVSGLAETVIPFEEVMACPKTACEYHPQDGRKPRKLEGSKVIVWGDHYAAADTAAHLAAIGKEVTIVTDRNEFASTVEVIHMYVLRKRFNQTDAEALTSKPFKFPVTVIEKTRIIEIHEGEVVTLNKQLKRNTIACDNVVTCWTAPNIEMLNTMKEAGLTVVNVGDAVAPRNLHAAVREGATAGLLLDEHQLVNPNNTCINEVPIDIAAQLLR
ncbi:MAG: FAD-dependent oxidoreductase [Bacteroidetes bacterium]|nr:FAD-dependent oxidoreductase [Bacteroidota bacterium]